MKKRLFTFLMYRYHQGVASEKEQALVDGWYENLDNEKTDISDNMHIRANRSLQRILMKMAQEDQQVNKSNRDLIKWVSIAATFFLVGIGGLYWYQSQRFVQETQEIARSTYRIFETHVGERKQITLPDGSTVLLNARSRIRIDEQQYGKTNRTVELLEGEAFFDVHKDSSQAFIVLAGALQTRVLGTSFNIQTYREMDEQVVSVYTGKVQVQHGEHTLGILETGEQIRFEKTSENSVTETFEADAARTWVSGRVFLAQASFEELALAMHNTYGISLKADTKQIANQQYSLPIQEQVPLADALRAICNIHKNQVRKEGDTVLIY